MKLKLAVLTVALFAVSALASAPAASAHGTCRHVWWDYTNAGVSAKNLSCDKARRIAKSYRNRMSDICDEYGCETTYIREFRCVYYGYRYHSVVKCRRSSRVVRISWGD